MVHGEFEYEVVQRLGRDPWLHGIHKKIERLSS